MGCVYVTKYFLGTNVRPFSSFDVQAINIFAGHPCSYSWESYHWYTCLCELNYADEAKYLGTSIRVIVHTTESELLHKITNQMTGQHKMDSEEHDNT